MIKSRSGILSDINESLAHDFRIMRLDRHDLPIFLAIALPMADGVTGEKPRLPAGRGTTLHQALVSAGAEALELRASLAQNQKPEAMILQDGVAMVEAEDLLGGDGTLVPASQIYLDCGPDGTVDTKCTTDSTGCAAGMIHADACRRGVLECIERDAAALWWYGGTQRGGLALDIIDPLHPRLVWWLQGRQRHTHLLDITQDNGVPVIAAFSADPDGTAVAVGTGAGLTAAQAALSAITEMIQIEVSMWDARAAGDPDLQLWLDTASTRSMPQFQAGGIVSPPSSVADIEVALRTLAYGGHRAHSVDLTLKGDCLKSVRVLVSGYCAMGGRLDAARFFSVTGRDAVSARLGPYALPEPY